VIRGGCGGYGLAAAYQELAARVFCARRQDEKGEMPLANALQCPISKFESYAASFRVEAH